MAILACTQELKLNFSRINSELAELNCLLKLSGFEELLDNQKSKCVILGDFNIDLLDHSNYVSD